MRYKSNSFIIINSMLLVWFGEQLSVPNYSPNQVKKTKSFEDRSLSIYNYTLFEKFEPEGRLVDW